MTLTTKLKTLALALMMTLPVMAIAMDNQDMQIDAAPKSNKRKAEDDPAAASKKMRENSVISLADADTSYTGRLGSPRDYITAAFYYKTEADKGSDYAQLRLGDMYYFGIGLAVDHAQAAQYYGRAAEQGNSIGQQLLGIMLFNGQGCQQDQGLAEYWFLKSGGQGNVLAQLILGQIYYSKKNFQAAITWGEQAEKKSLQYYTFITDAYYQLGLQWQQSSLVARLCLDNAIKCMKEAMRRGHFKAGNTIKTLGNENHFDRLPDEVIANVLVPYLTPKDCIRFMMSCKRAYPLGQRPDQSLPENFKLFTGCLVLYPSLTTLYLNGEDIFDDIITDAGLANCPNLTSLDLRYNYTITDAGLANCPNLTSLDLEGNRTITDAGLANCPNLTSLDLWCNNTITDAGLANCPNLTSLDLEGNRTITDAGLANCPNLTRLVLTHSQTITDAGLVNCPNLTSLDLEGNRTITDAGLANCPNLTSLDLWCNNTITDAGLANCQNLTSLNLGSNETITDKGLVNIPNLTSLDLRYNSTITDDLVSVLKAKGVIVTGR